MTRVIDELRRECEQPPVVYCIDNHQVLASRRATTLALRHRRYWLSLITVHALDAYPEPGQIGWRDATEEFITSRENEAGGGKQYGIILADGTARWT